MGAGPGKDFARRRDGELMNLDRVEKIAEAVLYEGYLLYPYRSSAVKNQQRWNFGVIFPPAYSDRQSGADRSHMQTQVLVLGDPSASVLIKVRCLRLVERVAGYLAEPLAKLPELGEPEFRGAQTIEI